ncbi:hypothetical protein CGC21_36840 [Leishmania donovani]|uniref:Uncharacterized protein n=1 Tax=Leishmania donovani TaxID=5661 RepID=A0A504X0H2_LEIDO|nr:hypothetical protein CGC21_36840 [Leishmania donovani]
MNDDVVRFFSSTSHYRPEVLRRIVMDINTVCNSLCFSRKITTWGSTEQPKICLYGGLPVSFPMIPRGEADGEHSAAKPPFIYLAYTRTSEASHIPESVNTSVLKIVNNHPNVDFTGLCFCKELAEWKPSTSSLCFTVERLGRALEKSGRCPIYIDQRICGNSPAMDSNNNDYGSKTNLMECPLCRAKIMVRQRVFE